MWDRRRLLQTLSVIGAAAALPITELLRSDSNETADAQAQVGELYNGFLLLPAEAPLPPTVRIPPSDEIPVMEQLGGGATPSSTTPTPRPPTTATPTPPTVARLDALTPADLAKLVSFPIVALRQLPAGLRQGLVERRGTRSGKTWMAIVNYESPVSWQGRTLQENSVSISAQPEFPRPFPVWLGSRANSAPAVLPRKVSFLPSPGLLLPTPRGFVLLWIKDDVLYTFRVENDANIASAQGVASSLAVVPR